MTFAIWDFNSLPHRSFLRSLIFSTFMAFLWTGEQRSEFTMGINQNNISHFPQFTDNDARLADKWNCCDALDLHTFIAITCGPLSSEIERVGDLGTFPRIEKRTTRKRLSSGTTTELSKCNGTKTQKFPARVSKPFHVSAFSCFYQKMKENCQKLFDTMCPVGLWLHVPPSRHSFQEANGKSSYW